jgi:DNA-binding transcriptional regulator YiaG
MEKKELISRRKRLGLNKSQFAKMLKTPYATYYKWELGDRRIPGIAEVAIDGLEFKEANRTSRG